MKHNPPALFALAVVVVACLPAALTQRAAPPTDIATIAILNTAIPTTRPTTTLPATATLESAPPSVATPSAVTITPTEQTLPAGASTTFFVSALKWTSGSPAVRWSVAGLPAGVTSEFMPDANPANSTLVVNTTCAATRGSYGIDVLARILQTTQFVKAKVNVGDRLVESRPGTFTGSYNANRIGVGHGGPGTYRYGPFVVLQFCDSAVPRMLNVRVQSATSDAGTPLAEPPSFTLFKSLVWPVPDYIQTLSAGYHADAREIAFGDGWSLKWTISGGVYVLAFLRSPFDDGKPPEKRPASVTYTVEIIR